jgi:mRNA export factor
LEYCKRLKENLYQDGTKVFSVGCDKQGKMLDLNTNQTVQVAAHDAPIKCCKYVEIPNMGSMLVTGSWDKTLKVFF